MIQVKNIGIFIENRIYAESLAFFLRTNNFNPVIYTCNDSFLFETDLIFDAIILDFEYGLKNNLLSAGTILNKVKELSPKLPVIVLSDYHNNEAITEAFSLGAHDILPKNKDTFFKLCNIIENIILINEFRRELKSIQKEKKKRITRAMVLSILIILVLIMKDLFL